jgi:hypothetical protein
MDHQTQGDIMNGKTGWRAWIAGIALCIGQSVFAQGYITNTATTITVGDTCLNTANVPAGNYTLTLHYNHLDTGPTGDVTYNASVANSGSSITITATGANFPALSSTYYWNLSDVYAGMIKLADGSSTYTMYWEGVDFQVSPAVRPFFCTDPIAVSNTNAVIGTSGNIELSWSLQNGPITGFGIFHSPDNVLFNYISQTPFPVPAPGFPGPGVHNYYYVTARSPNGTCAKSNTFSIDCPPGRCSYNPNDPAPAPQCPSYEPIQGPSHICNLQDHQHFGVAAITQFAMPYGATWSVAPLNANDQTPHAYLFRDDCNPTGASLIRTGVGGIVTLTAVDSQYYQSCGPVTKKVLMGIPATLHVAVSLTGSGKSKQGTATVDEVPEAAQSAYSWTLNLGSKGTSHYTGNGITFSMPACSGGTLSVDVATACGTAHDGVTVYNSSGCF